LSIPCKLVLNVVGIEETETLAVLKSIVCVSIFDSSSKFNLLKAVLISLNEVFLMRVGATGSVAPSSFHLSGKFMSCHCIVLRIVVCDLEVSVSIKRVSLFGFWSKALVLTTEYIALKWSV
ncbi:hypothetical protein Gotur_025150, partial [Gossypium turneri]